MDIWKFQRDLSRVLGFWGLMNIIGGVMLIARPGLTSNKRPRITAIGFQSAGWGVINALIAYFGFRSSKKKEANLPDPLDEEIQQKESRNLRRLLLINTGLDVLYSLGGASLIWKRDRNRPQIAGHGFGILIQAVFLFFFDLFHAARLD